MGSEMCIRDRANCGRCKRAHWVCRGSRFQPSRQQGQGNTVLPSDSLRFRVGWHRPPKCRAPNATTANTNTNPICVCNAPAGYPIFDPNPCTPSDCQGPCGATVGDITEIYYCTWKYPTPPPPSPPKGPCGGPEARVLALIQGVVGLTLAVLGTARRPPPGGDWVISGRTRAGSLFVAPQAKSG